MAKVCDSRGQTALSASMSAVLYRISMQIWTFVFFFFFIRFRRCWPGETGCVAPCEWGKKKLFQVRSESLLLPDDGHSFSFVFRFLLPFVVSPFFISLYLRVWSSRDGQSCIHRSCWLWSVGIYKIYINKCVNKCKGIRIYRASLVSKSKVVKYAMFFSCVVVVEAPTLTLSL